MEFINDTNYDQKAFTVMSKVLRKTVRKVWSLVVYIVNGTFALALLLGVPGVLFTLVFFNDDGESMLITWLVMVPVAVFIVVFLILVIALSIIYQDVLGGIFAKARMLPGTERATAVFTSDTYTITTAALKTEYQYNNISLIAETKDYYVFVLGRDYTQIFSKIGFTKGAAEDFRRFIEEKTNKKMVSIA